MKILLLLLSTLALSSIALAKPGGTTSREKELLEALLGKKGDNPALEQDMGQDLPPLPYGISQPNRAEKMDILVKLQALKKEAETNAEAQFLRKALGFIHSIWE